MDYQIFILSRNELKIIIISTVVGGILQIVCSKYLKNHPELLDNNNSKKSLPNTRKPGLRRFFPRGGAFIEFTGIRIVIDFARLISFLSRYGLYIGIGTGTGGVITYKIAKNSTAVSTVLRRSLPASYSDLEKGYMIIDGEKIVLEECDKSFEYLFKVLINKEIPFESKKDVSFKILMDHLDLKTRIGRIRFVICIVSFIYLLGLNDISGYFIVMQNLVKAIKNGKLSKRLARLIIRRLLKLGAVIDPELIEAAEYA